MSKSIYRFDFDAGIMGGLSGVFIAEDDAVKDLVASKKEVYFGEVLGKHSEICGPIEEKEITKVTDDPVAIEIFEKYELSSGYNPFDYINTDEEE